MWPGKMAEEVIEIKIIFTFQLQNIFTIPKIILLLNEMQVVIAFVPKKLLQQCFNMQNESGKKRNVLNTIISITKVRNMMLVIILIWKKM